MDRYLMLEDGTILRGAAYGHKGSAYGEIVFTTSMTGYMESLTDPSYRGQILIFAFPTIANYSFNQDQMESGEIQVEALVTKDAHSFLGAGKPGEEFEKYLSESGVPGIDGIDTRSLVKKIREKGVLKAWISDRPDFPKDWPDPMERNLVGETSTSDHYTVKGDGELDILFIDLGAKRSLVKKMGEMASSLDVVPYNFDLSKIDKRYDAIFLSNGPGDPSHESLGSVTEFVAMKVEDTPIYGVCLGHQIISIALGGRTEKMRFGHRGSNHAVTDGQRIWITTHNHGYAVNQQSLSGTPLKITQWDINDGTVEMVEHSEKPVFSVQYHPEASPGPHDAEWFFDKIKERTVEYYAKKA
ncbi:MAG TPA: glutamine-hydrolyzing carbamoyl-phosphate synthase small subunit [Thermoplasmataceae archaeon]|nr:glutamine-hydrolyzing carbamoyl-phosphate synthase small subunit [Thermoplasmataceae archaeon]